MALMSASAHVRRKVEQYRPIPGYQRLARVANSHPVFYWLNRFVRRELIWEDESENLVVTAGLNKLLDATFKTGSATPTWYVGLVNNIPTPVYAASDTMASHPGWIEIDPYSNPTRPAFTPGTIAGGSVDNSVTKAEFRCDTGGPVAGCFLVDNNTIAGAMGTLYGEGNFSSVANVLPGDILLVTITLTIS